MQAAHFISNGLRFSFAFPPDAPVRLFDVSLGLPTNPAPGDEKWSRLVELQINGEDWDDHHGNKYTGTNPAGQLRYEGHVHRHTPLGEKFEIVQSGGGLRVTTHLQMLGDLPAFRAWTEVVNIGIESRLLEYVSTFRLAGASRGGAGEWDRKMRLHLADNTWCGECQWRSGSLPYFGLSKVYPPAAPGFLTFSTHRIAISNQGTWSTSGHLPLGALENLETGETIFWQIEHNGSWHWEVSDIAQELYFALSGPTYRESHWSKRLAPQERFVTVPATIGRVKGDLFEALRTLTSARRLIRLPHPDMEKLPVIFNDYMNCLMAEPTTEKLLPLIDRAAEAGCEYFVIDAGWFSKLQETWWGSVGEWKPSLERFPEGLGCVMEYIRARNMIPGLWLEIEVVGIHAPVSLPDDWFFQRNGRRVIDHGRYQLDFRNPEVRAHTDGILDRLIREYSLGYIKMDYNINAGPGTDLCAETPGDGLLEHQRAYLEWVEGVLGRHPGLVIENCGSGGLRMDYAMLARHSIQSVSDQMDYRLNGVISAAAASAVTPEQAAIWSYPSANADEEEIIFNMVSVLLLRIHQSGRLDLLPEAGFQLVKEAIAFYKTIRHHLPKGLPIWPLGLAGFNAPWASYGIVSGTTTLLAVWRLTSDDEMIRIPLPHVQSVRPEVHIGFPQNGPDCWNWNHDDQSLIVQLSRPMMARLLVIQKPSSSP